MIELIGTNAGLVWNVLNEGGKMSFKAVKKATKIKAEKDMYAAFGWLAKEGKLAFEEIEGDVITHFCTLLPAAFHSSHRLYQSPTSL